MRKTIFVKTLCFGVSFFCLAAFGPASLPLSAQDAPAALPSDPKALMLLAAKSNGLTGDDVKPWHLKATYKVLDEQGNATDQGIYEEYWVSANKYKRVFTGKSFTQTDYGTDKGVLSEGSEAATPSLIPKIRNQFVTPFTSFKNIDAESFDLKQRELGNKKLTCLTLKIAETIPFIPTWCLDADQPILRIAVFPTGEQVVHNRVVRFQGRFIPGDLLFLQEGKASLSVHLDNLEPIASVDEAVFTPPPDAVAPQKLQIVQVSAAVALGFLIQKVAPEYPVTARNSHISGTVALAARIGKDGHIENLHVVSGPAILQQAALDAVKQWVYRPYLLNGEPVAVQTTINVIFGNPAR
jgi:TonB family protein